MVVECKVIGPVSGIAHPGPILGREANFLGKIFQFGVKTQPTVHILHLTHFDKDASKVAKKNCTLSHCTRIHSTFDQSTYQCM